MSGKGNNNRFIIIVLISVMLITAITLVDYYLNNRLRFKTLDFSEEQIAQLSPNFYLSIPARENPSICSDINSITFNDGDNTLYVLLPHSVDVTNLVCYIRDQATDSYIKRIVLDLSEDRVFAGRAITALSSNTPILYVSIDNDSMSYDDMILSNDRVNTCNGTLLFVENSNHSNTTNTDYRKHNVGLSMRGSGYQFNDKKSLTLSFDKKTELLDFGKQNKYNLISNNFDPSLLKSKLFFKMAEDIGMEYVPKAENVTLFIDGDYKGVYTLTTKLSVGKNKLPLSPNDYLINFGGTDPENIVYYDSETYFCDGDIDDPYFDVKYPYPLDDTTEIHNAVQHFISSIENTSDISYKEYMDIDSMIKYYWIQEISMNFDACFRSTYAVYNHKDSKIHMGPIWDMDLTLGSNFEKEGIMFNSPDGYRIRNMSWYPRLFARDEFKSAVQNEYESNNYSEILSSLSDYLREQEALLSVDGEMNYRLYRTIELNNILQPRTWTYKEFADSIIDFYDARTEWISKNLY